MRDRESFPILDRRISGGTNVSRIAGGKILRWLKCWKHHFAFILRTLRCLGKWTVRSNYSALSGSIKLDWYPLAAWSVKDPECVDKFCVCAWFLGCENGKEMVQCHAVLKIAVLCSDFGCFTLFHCFSHVRMDVSISFWTRNPESVLASLFSWWFQKVSIMTCRYFHICKNW